jgi:hypothetical protein
VRLRDTSQGAPHDDPRSPHWPFRQRRHKASARLSTDGIPALDFLSDTPREREEPETPIRRHPTLFQLRSGQCRFPSEIGWNLLGSSVASPHLHQDPTATSVASAPMCPRRRGDPSRHQAGLHRCRPHPILRKCDYGTRFEVLGAYSHAVSGALPRCSVFEPFRQPAYGSGVLTMSECVSSHA